MCGSEKYVWIMRGHCHRWSRVPGPGQNQASRDPVFSSLRVIACARVERRRRVDRGP
ncbi:hypothetical protein BVI434_400040 [Burkholderia vietnamiensis]|nr:hypothetical protein BVI434_400040 [Burkholderia vietnamiensis]